MNVPVLRSVGLIVLASTLAACGGEGPGGNVAEMAQDTFIKPLERQPLTEADLQGWTLAELALEVPWTETRISRDAPAGAPAAQVRDAVLSAHEGFDRTVFTLADGTVSLGYEVRFVASGESVQCGGDPRELTAERSLVVTLAPARGGDEGGRWIPEGVRPFSGTRVTRAGLLCDEADTVVWVAELAAGTQVRVLELRDPGRIAVDVR